MKTQATATAKASPPQQKWMKIHEFIKKHRRFIDLLAITIVLGTFVVKEGFREEMKITVNVIDQANDTFMLRTEFAWMESQMQRDSEELKKLEKPIQGSHVEPDHRDIVLTSLENAVRRLLVSGRLVSASISLVRLLPASDNRVALLDRIDEQNQRIKDIKNRNEWNVSSKRESGAYWLEREKAALALETEAVLVQQETAKVAGEMINKSEEIRERAQKRYELFSWGSYFLYAFGWGLGLVGRLVGVNAGGDD